jgi:hypothetical protein
MHLEGLMLKIFPERFLARLALLVTIACLPGRGLDGAAKVSTDGTQKQHKVILSWISEPSVEGYYVYRGLETGGPYTKISALQPTASYIDNAVKSGKTYYYVVTSLSSSGESGYSDQVQAVIPTP